MSNIKRLNLCFNLDNERHRQAYNKILAHSTKTDFIVGTVLAYQNPNNTVGKQLVKDAVMEAFKEIGIDKMATSIEMKQDKQNNDIPDEILDIFDQI